MKRIELKRLELSNFKGIKHFVLDANGANVDVYGDNATGKTTIFDAFTWLLFDKDSQDKKDFQLKTVDVEGKEQHHLDHGVSGSFVVDGRPIELQKVFKEKWTKKRGSATSEFSGHTTDYYIDGVPVKKKEYDDAVSELVNENEQLFKLLTSPTYFNEVLNWKQRRKALLNVCGDLTDAEVIASKKELSELPSILGEHSIEDLRKIIASKRATINKELDRIPVKIKEAEGLKPDLDGQTEDELKIKTTELQERINLIDDKIRVIRSGGEIDEKRNEIRKIEGIQLDMHNNFQADVHKQIDAKNTEYYSLKARIDKDLRRSKELQEEIASNTARVQKYGNQLEDMRHEWQLISGREFEFTDDTVCPECGQLRPEDQIDAAKEHAEKHFNLRKSQDLEENKRQGLSIRAHLDELNAEAEKLKAEAQAAEERAKAAQPDLDAIKKEIDDLNAGMKSIFDDPNFQATQKQIKAIELEIKELQSSTDDAVMAENEKKRALKQELATTETALLKFDQVRRIDKRIAELEAQEKELAKAFEQTEYELNLTDVFVRTKVDLLEERINSKFKMARFKLFSEQINGGLQEVCETTYNGVPYNALNNAAKINVGLDIIQTLSEFYELSAPIFIDNREAVTKLVDIDAQVISLIVSAEDKQLRIEKDTESLQEVI
ncbi:AAA family ATPase [Sporolactobacillus shoreicorticis]|uniref:Nuclease SbcCD subunit C n=1 Tax=Sporolactobacillus shoreicorticis TaxID=1923877 RepID=A0ABW5S5E4_9BACL|nr:AAA family ATPase [Sporolactobacillus shoreicorticis]MCO7127772.1 AAA family ATPase [Sporolactobacillus shoreicorticis]